MSHLTKKISFGLFLGTLLSGLIVYQSCGRSVDVYKPILPPIGEKITLKSSPYSDSLDDENISDFKNVYFTVVLGSKGLTYSDATIIRMFANKGDETPVYEFAAADLAHMHEATECDKDMHFLLQNGNMGDSLFCNGSLDISNLTYFEAIRPNRDPKVATAIQTTFVRQELNLIGLELVLF